MRITKRRYQFRIEREKAIEVQRLAEVRGVSTSDALAFLVARGLEREAHLELTQLTQVCDSLKEDSRRLLAQADGLNEREGGRFRYVLGHLQQLQALLTELVQVQRVLMLADRPTDYSKAVELARRQVTEDAALYRSSLTGGAVPRHQAGREVDPERAA